MMKLSFDVSDIAEEEKPLIDEIRDFINMSLYAIRDFDDLDGGYVYSAVGFETTVTIGVTVRFVHENLGYMIGLDNGDGLIETAVTEDNPEIDALTDELIADIAAHGKSSVLTALIKGLKEMGFSGKVISSGRAFAFRRGTGLMKAVGVVITSDIEGFKKIDGSKNIFN